MTANVAVGGCALVRRDGRIGSTSSPDDGAVENKHRCSRSSSTQDEGCGENIGPHCRLWVRGQQSVFLKRVGWVFERGKKPRGRRARAGDAIRKKRPATTVAGLSQVAARRYVEI